MTATEEATTENISARLAMFAANYDLQRASTDVRDAAKALILDGLGVMVAGAKHPVAAIILRYIDEIGGREDCTLLGSQKKTNPPLAAFAHGVMLHVNDFEIQGAMPTHGTSNLLPPALAISERNGRDGADLLAAVIVGWEVMVRIRSHGTRTGGFNGFHPPGIFGPFGAAAVAGRLLGLDAERMNMAFGIAGSRAAGLFANNGTMVKSTHPANAGRMGVESAMLAELGFISNADILSAPQGFISTLFDGRFDKVSFLDGLDDARYLVDPGYSIKRYPAEIYMQRIIEAAADLKAEHNLALDDIEHVDIVLPRREPAQLSRPFPKSGLDGKFSYEYCAAVGLAEEHVGLRSFYDETRFSAPIEQLLPKITAVADESIPDAVYEGWITVRARLRDGSVIESTCHAWKGSIPNPMTRDERLFKFRACTAETWTEAETEEAIEAVEHIETPGKLARVIELLGTTKG